MTHSKRSSTDSRWYYLCHRFLPLCSHHIFIECVLCILQVFPKKKPKSTIFFVFFSTDFHSIEYDRQMLKHTSMAVGRFKCEWHSFEQAFLYLSNILKIRKNYSNYVKREKREFHGKLFNLFNCSSYFSTVTVGCMDKKTHTFWAKKCHFNLLFFYEYIGTGQKNSTY